VGKNTTIRDDFNRDVKSGGWGTATISDANANGQAGQKWQIATGSKQAFSVAAGTGGQIAVVDTQQDTVFYTALLGTMSKTTKMTKTTVEGSLSFAMQGFDNNNRQANVGVVLRWQDKNNYVKAYLDGAELLVMKNVNGKQTVLQHTKFVATDGTSYTVRFRIQGNAMMARAWQSDQQEPKTWVRATDTQGDATTGGQNGANDAGGQNGTAAGGAKAASGKVGVRALLPAGAMVTCTAFQMTLS
jgi:hypothetical protein